MKQIVENTKTGLTEVVDVPIPIARPGYVLVRTVSSAVSPGTERSVVEFSQKSLMGKARSRPDLVKQVLRKVKQDGVLGTMELVKNRLDQSIALGYSSAGHVLEVGEGIDDLEVGDRVACAGAFYAVHAEVVAVPRNLICKVPAGVKLEEAAFSTLGTISMHGVRLAEPQVGERICVIGLGMVGILAVQILDAAGCVVLGMDPDRDRCELAKKLGCTETATSGEELESLIATRTAGAGADAVVIAAGTSSNATIELAGSIARDRANVVVIGAVGLDIPRRSYFAKELSFRISRSYGPGRYDPQYEEKGNDYPIGYVRWTQNRNMESFLTLIEQKKIDVLSLVTHRYEVDKGDEAYQLITGKTGERYLGVLIEYPEEPSLARSVEVSTNGAHRNIATSSEVTVGMIGAGGFATGTLLPAMKKVSGVHLLGVCTAKGHTGHHVAKQFGFKYCTTDREKILKDPDVNTVAVLTRHHLHAKQVIQGLEAGKNVFCEKPLAMTREELSAVIEAHRKTDRLLTVGYNRRFAPLAIQMRDFLKKSGEPLAIQFRANAGFLPKDHWTQDPNEGGGRLIGEACHFVDFVTFLVGASPISVSMQELPSGARYCNDNFLMTLTYPDGSIGSIWYLANGDSSVPKERVEAFGGASVAMLDDFRSLELTIGGKTTVQKSRLRKDKGHRGEWEALAASLKSGEAPIPMDQIISTSLATIAARESLADGSRPVSLELP
ncbi:MAG: bi-domain-containing oxidoreductase [Planctomycetota bacterium]